MVRSELSVSGRFLFRSVSFWKIGVITEYDVGMIWAEQAETMEHVDIYAVYGE